MKKYVVSFALSVALVLLVSIPVLAVPTAITNFIGIPTDTEISLSWELGSGNQTLVRYKTNGYPANTADGTQIYLGAGNSYQHTGLTAGAVYYYSAWSYDGVDYSAAAANLIVATNATSLDSGDSLPTQNVDASFIQDPDATKISTFEPFYTWGNNFFTGWDIDPDRGWEVLFLFVTAGLAIMTYTSVKNFGVAYIVMVAMLAFGVRIDLLSGWFVYGAIALGLGGWGMDTMFNKEG